MQDKSALERVTGSLSAKVLATSVSLIGGAASPLAAFVPLLVDSLAGRRQAARIEDSFKEIKGLLEKNNEVLDRLSDDQYKVISEAIVSALHTIDIEKLTMLRRAIEAAISDPEIVHSSAESISRVVRDISASEASFVVASFSFKEVSVKAGDSQRPDVLYIDPGSKEEMIVPGLISLGLLYAKFGSWDEQTYEWSPLAAKLIALLRPRV